ncbi:MAG: SpoIIE family protein phosphatase [Acidobacteriota bacterium]|nr:SpoIIE family protein phosphatase [Acidobacteriota bacterium]
MSDRRRLVLIYAITIAVIGAALAYTAVRVHAWHVRGWTGLFYYPNLKTNGPSGFTAAPGEVLMTYSGTPAERVMKARDRIVSVNGVPISEMGALRALDARTPGRATIRYRVQRGDKQLDIDLPLASPLHSPYVIVRSLVSFLVAFVFVAVALVVFTRRPDDRRAAVFYAFTIVSALTLLARVATLFESAGGRGISPVFGLSSIEPILFFCITVAYAPLILHLSLIFPRERPIVVRNPNVIRWIYAGALLATLLFASMGALSLVFFNDPSQMSRGAYNVGRVAGIASKSLMVIGLLFAIVVVIAGRGEGIVRRFARRPFLSVFAAFALMIAITMLLARYLSRGAGVAGAFIAIALVGLTLLSYPVLAAIALLRSYRAAGVEEKRQVQWPLWGLFIALAVRILAVAFSFIAGVVMAAMHLPTLEFRFWFELADVIPTLVSLLIPISFAVAILKYRLMNIDVIIRKTVVYAILSTAILIFYIALVGGLGTLLIAAAGMQNQTLIVASTLIVAVAFVPLRNKLQTLVDRNLFRHRYDYPDALRAISTTARTAHVAHDFLATVAEKLQQALQNRAIVIFTERQDELVAVAKVGVSDTLVGRLRVPRSFVNALDRPFDPRRRTLPEETAAALARIETALVVPAGPRAFIAAAPKLAGGELDIEDIEFLRSAAEEVALATDRIRMQSEEADFAQARAIQQTLLPREMPRIEKLDLSGIWQPARAMGGDYYDLLKLGEHELAVCIGDVAGKGMPAALLMSGLQAAVRASASSSPRDLCERVRRVVVSSLSGGRFVTFFYATLDTAAMTLRWCNAGHNAPILARADGTIVRLAEGGPAISRLFRDRPYEEREIALAPGDRLVLFTDGVSEATDASGELFGEQRIEELVGDARALDAHELQRTIVDASTSFSGGEIEDDVTLVVIGVAA